MSGYQESLSGASLYRSVLAERGVRSIVLMGVVVRLPDAAVAVILGLHVVATLGLGYGEVGLLIATLAVGKAVGSPWRGRAFDRVGLRRTLLPSVIAAAVIWGLSPWLPFPLLLMAVAMVGLLGLPVFTVIRLALAVLVPVNRRRTAFALDSVSIELSYVIGPALGVFVATQISTEAGLLAIGATNVVVGLALMAMNPPIATIGLAAATTPYEKHGEGGSVTLSPRAERMKFTAPISGVLVITAAAAMVVGGMDVAILAYLNERDAEQETGLVFAVWAFASLVGGICYGALRSGVRPAVLLIGLALFTIPVGFVPGPAWLYLAVVPAGFMGAPLVTATAEAIAASVGEHVRGAAMGWHTAALTAGVAAGALLSGFSIDLGGPWAGFAVVGAIAGLVGLIGLAPTRSSPTSYERKEESSAM